ncbi:hypothetical protein ZIOFF_051186 [Zingiber officinale]|uniref:SNARE-complex protein Syntaxin-18 N-terminal domain-containing protein n=1 Tax=Zingiber officinale TaxID=94328 RepID=A0A8J5FS74_ZINOF|nr:hypothetical protein ZIOFF_051186 [Zingiber officinale]
MPAFRDSSMVDPPSSDFARLCSTLPPSRSQEGIRSLAVAISVAGKIFARSPSSHDLLLLVTSLLGGSLDRLDPLKSDLRLCNVLPAIIGLLIPWTCYVVGGIPTFSPARVLQFLFEPSGRCVISVLMFENDGEGERCFGEGKVGDAGVEGMMLLPFMSATCSTLFPFDPERDIHGIGEGSTADSFSESNRCDVLAIARCGSAQGSKQAPAASSLLITDASAHYGRHTAAWIYFRDLPCRSITIGLLSIRVEQKPSKQRFSCEPLPTVDEQAKLVALLASFILREKPPFEKAVIKTLESISELEHFITKHRKDYVDLHRITEQERDNIEHEVS